MVKQMKIIHGDGYSQSELRSFKVSPFLYVGLLGLGLLGLGLLGLGLSVH